MGAAAGAEAGEDSGPPEEAPRVGKGVPHRTVGTSWGRDRGPGAWPPPLRVRVALALDGRGWGARRGGSPPAWGSGLAGPGELSLPAFRGRGCWNHKTAVTAPISKMCPLRPRRAQRLGLGRESQGPTPGRRVQLPPHARPCLPPARRGLARPGGGSLVGGGRLWGLSEPVSPRVRPPLSPNAPEAPEEAHRVPQGTASGAGETLLGQPVPELPGTRGPGSQAQPGRAPSAGRTPPPSVPTGHRVH